MEEDSDVDVCGGFYEDDRDGEQWCERCHNTGELDCFCGGDFCVCMNYGSYPCPSCQF